MAKNRQILVMSAENEGSRKGCLCQHRVWLWLYWPGRVCGACPWWSPASGPGWRAAAAPRGTRPHCPAPPPPSSAGSYVLLVIAHWLFPCSQCSLFPLPVTTVYWHRPLITLLLEFSFSNIDQLDIHNNFVYRFLMCESTSNRFILEGEDTNMLCPMCLLQILWIVNIDVRCKNVRALVVSCYEEHMARFSDLETVMITVLYQHSQYSHTHNMSRHLHSEHGPSPWLDIGLDWSEPEHWIFPHYERCSTLHIYWCHHHNS